MLNRRHIRIKVLQILFAYYSDVSPDAKVYENMLFESIHRFRDLYVSLLLLLAEMQSLAIEKIEAGMNKRLPSHEDLHPNAKFVTNELLRTLANSKKLAAASKEVHLQWRDNKDLLKQMFKMLTETEDYKEYMASKERGFEHDREYLLRFFRRHLVNFESMHDYLEDKGIFWNDDLDLASSMVLRTLKTVKEGEEDITFLPLWKEGDDEEEFCRQLFRKTLAMGADNEKLISDNTPNWETDRIALMDMILLKMAFAEAATFESIPVKVTMNEYIELSKYYSTPKSATFVNGLLDHLIPKLQAAGKVKKVGRGLLE
ncbi:MAG: transcription antitermination protein NusB [Crocinitomicaceae bacterium]|nr:transcription antitermination protein NusB [Crocinitomicaceae bacterium]